MMKKTFVLLFITTVFVLSQLVMGCGGSSGGDEDDYGFIKTIDSVGIVGLYTSIAVNGDNVYVSYFDSTNMDLKFARSTDGGATWSAGNIKAVDSAGDVGYFTSIKADGSNIYISYLDGTNNELKIAKSTDSGATWPAGNIKTVDTNGVGYFTSTAVDGANVYISYGDTTNLDLKFAKSTDGGATWPAGNIKTIDSAGSVGNQNSIMVNGSIIYISYLDGTNYDLKIAKSTDGGATWPAGNIKTVDSAGSVGYYTSIVIDGANVYISYFYGTNNDLKFARSTDSGATWPAGNIKTVDFTVDVGLYSSITVDGANIYISYYDQTNGDLKLAKSIDSGTTWQ
jgi:hypothetical protein